jgi:hypothetical protein
MSNRWSRTSSGRTRDRSRAAKRVAGTTVTAFIFALTTSPGVAQARVAVSAPTPYSMSTHTSHAPVLTPPAPVAVRLIASSSHRLSYLDAVTCLSSAFCVAVGYSADDSGNAKTLIESWNGRRWTLVASPNRITSDYNQLYAVSCSSTNSCAAVGRAHDRHSGFQRTLTESWNGRTWSLVPSFNPSPHADNVLNGVSCTQNRSCVAVGYAADTKNGVWHTLAESWNGHAWVDIPSLNASATENNYLLSVACRSSNHCVAAGYHYRNLLHTLVETWDGLRWSIVKSADALTKGNNILYAVSCSSGSDCTGVGSTYIPVETTPTNQNLIEVWNGQRWTVASSPNTSPTERNTLNGVSCVSKGTCVAVGTYLAHRNGFNQTLILARHGSIWKVISSPNVRRPTSGEDNWLNGVSCVSAGACTAVGYSTNSNAVSSTLVETWNGQRWTITSSPNP